MLRKNLFFPVPLIAFLILFTVIFTLGYTQESKIAVIHAKGSHYEAGYQIGTRMKAQLRELVRQSKDYTKKMYLAKGNPCESEYYEYTF